LLCADHHDHFLVPEGDGLLLRRELRGRLARVSSLHTSALSARNELCNDGDDVRLHRRRNPLRRPQAERFDVQLLQMGHLPAGDEVRRRPEERRVRFRLRLPVVRARGAERLVIAKGD
jgi:hypothetical protein